MWIRFFVYIFKVTCIGVGVFYKSGVKNFLKVVVREQRIMNIMDFMVYIYIEFWKSIQGDSEFLTFICGLLVQFFSLNSSYIGYKVSLGFVIYKGLFFLECLGLDFQIYSWVYVFVFFTVVFWIRVFFSYGRSIFIVFITVYIIGVIFITMFGGFKEGI